MEHITTMGGLQTIPTATQAHNVSRPLSAIHTLTTLVLMADDYACNGHTESQGPVGIVADTRSTNHAEMMDALGSMVDKIKSDGIEIQGIQYTKGEVKDGLAELALTIDEGANPSGYRLAYGNRRIYALALLAALNVSVEIPTLEYSTDAEADAANIRENGSEATTKPLTIQDRVLTATRLLDGKSHTMAELRRLMGITHGASQVVYHAARACRRHKPIRKRLEEGKLAIPSKYELWKKLADEVNSPDAITVLDAKEATKAAITGKAITAAGDNALNPMVKAVCEAIATGDSEALHALGQRSIRPVQVQTALEGLKAITGKTSRKDVDATIADAITTLEMI